MQDNWWRVRAGYSTIHDCGSDELKWLSITYRNYLFYNLDDPKGRSVVTLLAMGLLGTLTYENPSPQPVGSADPVTAS